MTQPQAKQTRQVKTVSGFSIPKRDMEAYGISDAFCCLCGEPGWDRCPACRQIEKGRLARLEATPGGKEVGQGSALE